MQIYCTSKEYHRHGKNLDAAYAKRSQLVQKKTLPPRGVKALRGVGYVYHRRRGFLSLGRPSEGHYASEGPI